MQETHKSCFGSKKRSTILRQAKTGKHEYQNITAVYKTKHFLIYTCYILHSCLSVFAWWRVMICFFDLKQLLRIFCILWCYYPKCYSIFLENTSLWFFIIILIHVTLWILNYIISNWKNLVKSHYSADKK